MDVFISYSRSDRELAERVRKGLRQFDYSVWIDQRIPPGETWDTYIPQKIREAKAVVVIWSATSASSDAVFAEANMAKEHGSYIPVTFSRSAPPFGLERYQIADLGDWGGEPDHANWRLVLDAVARRVEVGSRAAPASAPDQSAATKREVSPRRPRRLGPVMAVIVVLALSVGAAYWILRSQPQAPLPLEPPNLASCETWDRGEPAGRSIWDQYLLQDRVVGTWRVHVGSYGEDRERRDEAIDQLRALHPGVAFDTITTNGGNGRQRSIVVAGGLTSEQAADEVVAYARLCLGIERAYKSPQ